MHILEMKLCHKIHTPFKEYFFPCWHVEYGTLTWENTRNQKTKTEGALTGFWPKSSSYGRNLESEAE